MLLKKQLGNQTFIEGSDNLFIKKQLHILLIGLLVFTLFPVATLANDKAEPTTDTGRYSTKDEVIYGKLDETGKPKNMYVVNSFNVTKPGEFFDYGTYTNVRNLTDLSTIEQSDTDEIHFKADDDFYYQGELENKALPWNIAITYLLDGKKMNPDELAGQSGKLEIQIKTTANKAVDPVFFDYYLLQISIKLDTLIFENIHAPKATEAKEGKDSLISFNVMPGQDEVIILTAHAQDLKMDPIDIVAIPANLAIEGPDTDDLTSDIQKLVDAIDEIHSGVGKLKSGATQLSDGAGELSTGSNDFQKGINELDQSSAELVNGSEQILSVFEEIDGALDEMPELPDLADLKTLPKELRAIAKELNSFSKTLDEITDAVDAIPESNISQTQFNALYDAVAKADGDVTATVQQLEATYYAAQAVKELSQETPAELAVLMKETASAFKTTADELDVALASTDELDNLADLTDGLSQLTSEYQTFHNGLVQYTDGVGELATSYQGLNSGTKDLANGTSELSDGVSDLHDGTTELQKETSDLPDQLKSEIDILMEEFDYSGFKPTSFVSKENEKVGVIQFVLQTESIELDEEVEVVEEEEAETSLWKRFLGLFM